MSISENIAQEARRWARNFVPVSVQQSHLLWHSFYLIKETNLGKMATSLSISRLR